MATNSIDIGVALHGFGLADEAFGVLSNSLNQVGERARFAKKAFDAWKIDKNIKNFEDMNEATEATMESVKDFATTGLTLLGTKLTALSRALIGAGSELQQMKIALKTLSTEGENTAQTLEKIKEVAKLPGLDFKQALKGITVLRASGIEASLATEAVKQLGNALASVGADPQELQGVIRAFSQIQSKGKIYAEEILQIAERLPQIRKIMLETFGTANTEILQAEGFTSEEFIEAITHGLSKLTRVEDNAVNAMQNLENSVFQLKSAIGEQLLDQVQSLLEWLTNIILKISEWDSKNLKLIGTIVGIAGVVSTLTAGIIALWKAMTMLTAVNIAVKAQVAEKALGAVSVALKAVGLSAVILKYALAGLGVGLAVLVGIGIYKYFTKTEKKVKKVKDELLTLTDHIESLQEKLKGLGDRQEFLDTLDLEISRLEAIEGYLNRASELELERYNIMKQQSELKILATLQAYNETMIKQGARARYQENDEGKKVFQIQRADSSEWETIKNIQDFKKESTKQQLDFLQSSYDDMTAKFSENADNIENALGVYDKVHEEVTTSFGDLFEGAYEESFNVLKYARTILGERTQKYTTAGGKKGLRTNILSPLEALRKELYTTMFDDANFLTAFYEKGITYVSDKAPEEKTKIKFSQTRADLSRMLTTAYEGADPKDIESRLIRTYKDIVNTQDSVDPSFFLQEMKIQLKEAFFSPKNLEQTKEILSRIQIARNKVTNAEKDITEGEFTSLNEFLDKWKDHTDKAQQVYISHFEDQYAQQAEDMKILFSLRAEISALSIEEPEDALLLGLMSKNAVEKLKTLKMSIDNNEEVQKSVFEYLSKGQVTIGEDIPETLKRVLTILRDDVSSDKLTNILKDPASVYADLEGIITSSWTLIVDGLIEQTTAFGKVISLGGKNLAQLLLYDSKTKSINLDDKLDVFVDIIKELGVIFPQTLSGKTNIGFEIENAITNVGINELVNKRVYQEAFGVDNADKLRKILAKALTGQRPVGLASLLQGTEQLDAYVKKQTKNSVIILDQIQNAIIKADQGIFETYLQSLEIRKQQILGLTLEFEGNVAKELLNLGEGMGIGLTKALDEIAKKVSYKGDNDKITYMKGFNDLLDRVESTPLGALDPLVMDEIQQKIQDVINSHAIWDDQVKELNNKYTEMNRSQGRERKKILAEAVYSLTGMYFVGDKLITEEQMKSVTELAKIEELITAEKNEQDRLTTQITKATSQLKSQNNLSMLEKINTTLGTSYKTTKMTTEQVLQHINTIQKKLGGADNLKILQGAFNGKNIDIKKLKNWNEELGSAVEMADRLKVLGFLISLSQKQGAENAKTQSVLNQDGLVLSQALNIITKEQQATQKENLQWIRERIKLLERNNTLIEKMLGITTDMSEKYRLQEKLFINRNTIINQQISLAEKEKEQLEGNLSLSKEQLILKQQDLKLNDKVKASIQNILNAMELAGNDNIENLKKQESGYNDLIEQIKDLRMNLRITNFEMVQAINAITDERISKYFESLKSDLSTANMILEDTADIAENAKLGIQFLGVGIGEIVSSEAMDKINQGVLGELKDTSKMAQVLKKREVIRRDFSKREEVFTLQIKEINEVLKKLGNDKGLARDVEVARQDNINEQIYQLNQERIQKEAQFNRDLRKIYNENIKRNNDKIQNELDYQKTVSDLQEKDEMQQFEAGWKGSQKRKGQAYQDAKKEASLRAQNKGLDRMYKIQMSQLQLKKDELNMTGDENLYDVGLSNEAQKVLHEEQIFLMKHEQSKIEIQQEADRHNMKLEDKRRSGSISFAQKYQNSVKEAWRKHKSDLFGIEQEYQAKMKGMYDSEGKVLKDKKEQHDKLQTEEALKRKQVNQTYLAEQTNLYTQLEKDKKSAEQKRQRGRSIDPFAPDPEDVKDSLEQIERDRRRIMNKTFTLQHYQKGKVMDEEQSELLIHLKKQEQEQINISKAGKKWYERGSTYTDRLKSSYTTEMEKMRKQLETKEILGKLLDPKSGMVETSGFTDKMMSVSMIGKKSVITEMSAWEQMFSKVLSDQWGAKLDDEKQEKAIQDMLGVSKDTENRKAEYIYNLSTGGIEALKEMALAETGSLLTGGRTKGTLMTVEQAIENGTRSIVGALNLLGAKLVGDTWENAPIISATSPVNGTMNSISRVNGAESKLQDITTNQNVGGGGGGRQTVGLVKIEINGDELPIFGQLSVDAINSHASGGGGFTKIFKEAISPRDKQQQTRMLT